MPANKKLFVFIILFLCFSCKAQTIHFSNLDWEVRDGYQSPGPNQWSQKNVWLDTDGQLHLKITNENGKWYCAGIYSKQSFGFGQYWFYIIGRLDQLDKNVALALYNYPLPNTFPDGTNEIDIEFSHWGSPLTLNASYTIWPVTNEIERTLMSFNLQQPGEYSTHGFTWLTNKVYFQSGNGHHENYDYPILSWLFDPPNYAQRIPQDSLPIHIDLYLLKGAAPINGKEVEIIIKQFCYKSLDGKQNNCAV